MKITVLPPQERPEWAREWTASTPEIALAIASSGTCKIDQRQEDLKPKGPNSPWATYTRIIDGKAGGE